MEKICARQLAKLFLVFALLLGIVPACQKKTETRATPSPTPALPSWTPAPPITGPLTPALVKQEKESITRYLHYPKNPEAAKLDSAVQFYCDVNENGIVETTYALVASNHFFKDAVQTALDWGRFTPATVNGKPVPTYVGGTVLFLHQNGQELIVVSLATHDRDRVGKLANYIQPQLVGGLRHALNSAITSAGQGVLISGKAEVVVNVDARGAVTGTSSISESPKGSGLGILLDGAVRQAQFTPAYENGRPVAGGINVVANSGKF